MRSVVLPEGVAGSPLPITVRQFDYSNLGKRTLKATPDPFIKQFDGRVYYDPWTGIDLRYNPWMRNNRAVKRAIWAYASSSQTVPTILPTFLSPDYIYAVPTDAPAYAAIPRKASLGAMAPRTIPPTPRAT